MSDRARWTRWPARLALVALAVAGGGRTVAMDEFRGMWVTRFEWPNTDETACKAYIDQVMADLAGHNFNAVIMQMRGQADVLYPSPYEPWSPLISPTGSPLTWDPLAYSIAAAHNAGLEFHAYINTHAAWQAAGRPNEEIVVDNLSAGFAVLSGTWGTSSNSTAYATPTGNYRTRAAATTTTGEVEWRPTLPAEDWYEVSVWHPTAAGGITNAQFTIDHATGSTTYSVNQTINGGRWNVIAAYLRFAAGTTGRVRLSNKSTSSGTVFADAVRFRRCSPASPNHVYWQHCNALDPAHRDWLIHDGNGDPVQYDESNYVWMAPGVPAFQAYTRQQIMYVVQNYDVDGVHFDRIRTPKNDSTTRSWSHDPISQARFGGEGNPDNLDWASWSRDQITRFTRDIYAQIQEARPHVKVSCSPLGLYSPERYASYGGYPQTACGFQYEYTCVWQDAQGWLAAGSMDFIVPMIYWANGGSKPDYDEVFYDWITHSSGRHVVGGQAAYKAEMTLAEMVHQVQYTRQTGGHGNVPFSYTSFTLWDDYVAPGGVYEQPANIPPMPWKTSPTTGVIIGTVTKAGNPVVDAQITRSDDPASYTALSSADGLYSFLLVPPGTYTLTLTKQDTGTRQIAGVTVFAGQVTRVNISLGPDFDGDGDVDLTDFTAFQGCFNGPNATPAASGCGAADLDSDGDVDLADFNAISACFNGPNRAPACP